MRPNRFLIASLALGLLASMVAASPAQAAFPGANGRLVFQRELPAGDHTQTDVYTIRPDGSGLKRLTSTAAWNEFGPAWNAAGTRIAFWRTAAPFGPGSIWVMNADGTNPRRLTSGFDARDPVWNPAGTRIAFTRFETSSTHIWSLRTSDGKDLRRLTTGPVLDFEPAWSPDGTAIAFSRGFPDGDVGDLYVFQVSTRVVSRVTHSADYDHQVSWAPRGHRLVFERDTAQSSSIYAVNSSGALLTRLTSGPYFDIGPTFSPDKSFIAFGSDRGSDFFHDLWVMRADGRDLHRIRALSYAEGFPDWQPLPG